MEVARKGCPDLETRRGIIADRPQVCVDVMYWHEKYTKKKQLLGACSHDPPCKIEPLVGCVINARTAESGVRPRRTKSAGSITATGSNSRAAHPKQTTRRLTSAS